MQHHFRSSNFGMRQFPVGAAEAREYGDHIMGVTVMAWLTRFTIAEWGEQWATGGSLDLRFRSHLSAGLDLMVEVEATPEEMTFAIIDAEGVTYATASARRQGTLQPAAADTMHTRDRKVPNTREGLDGLVLTPIQFSFVADRDLEVAPGIEDGAFWLERRWAHPSFLGSASNAIILENVDFTAPRQWYHSGLQTTMHAPVTDGAEVVMAGHVVELFDTPRNQFAIAAIEATVDGVPVMSLRSTFVYQPLG